MTLRFRRLVGALFIVGCGAATASREAPHPSPPATRTGDAWVTARCAAEYRQLESNWASYTPPDKATSPFAHCPHWRMAAPDACGSAIQPSFINPCQCMCDLCETDADCGAGASCVSMSSVICGGYDERVCVKETDPCYPNNVRAKCPTSCVTLFGKPQCVSKADLAGCGRRR